MIIHKAWDVMLIDLGAMMFMSCNYIIVNNLKHTVVGYANALTHPDTNGESKRGINKNLDFMCRDRFQTNLLYVLGTN